MTVQFIDDKLLTTNWELHQICLVAFDFQIQ